MDRYRRNAGAVSSLKYHLVWCPKYRRAVLVDAIEARLKRIIQGVTSELGMAVHALEVMPDRVHLFVEADPVLCVAEIVNRIKGRSSRLLREEFPTLRSRLPTLWSRSYYAGSVGHVSAKTVQAYIEAAERPLGAALV
jgi:putative transposase